MGHVRDLPPDALGVDLDPFQSTYQQLKGQASAIYLATDPDREDEAIAWHLLPACRPAQGTPVHRVAFHSITPEAIAEAFRQRRALDMDLVSAQQVQRIIR